MKLALFNRLRCYSLGLYIGEGEIDWSVSALTLRGRRVIARDELKFEPQQRDKVLAELLETLTQRFGKKLPVRVGLAAGQTFYATVQQTTHQENSSSVLSRHAAFSSIAGESLATDMFKLRVRGKALAAVAACRKAEIEAILGVIRGVGIVQVYVEPGPWSLMRSQECGWRAALPFLTRQRSSVMVRVFIRERRVLAILGSDQKPLLWRMISLPGQADDSVAVQQLVSTIRGLELYARQHVGQGAVDSMVLDGPASAANTAQSLSDNLGQKVAFVASEQTLGTRISRDLSLAISDPSEPKLDLARTLRPPPTLWEMAPRGEGAVLLALIVVMGLWLSYRAQSLSQRADEAESTNRRHALLREGGDSALRSEQERLGMEVKAVRQFVTSRSIWTPYLNELAGQVRQDTPMISFCGEQQVVAPKGASGKTKSQVLMSFQTAFPPDEVIPGQVREMVKAVRGMPPIQRKYPGVELVSLRTTGGEGGNGPVRAKKTPTARSGTMASSEEPKAEFTILCLPKGGGVVKGAAKKGKS